MNKTQKLTYTAMLTALCVAANFLTVPVAPNKYLSFAIVLCFFAGARLGWISGIVVGFAGDLIAHLIRPMGAYNWFIGLSCALFGLVAAITFRLKTNLLAQTAIATVVAFVVCSCALNTFGLWLNYIVGVSPDVVGLFRFFAMDKGGIKKSFWLYLAGRLPLQALNAAVNGLLAYLLLRSKVIAKAFHAE